MEFLTILTPTYNRGEQLENLYESLKRQTKKNFQWYIVDDGSTDQTEKIVKKFQKESNFPIQYQKKKNGGKHTAINFAMPQIDSELTMIVDSDDLLIANATNIIFEDWISNVDSGISELVYLRGYSGYEVIGKSWPHDEQIGNSITHTWNKGITGDKAEVFLTSVLQEHPFPELDGEKFLSEACVWIEIAKETTMFMRNQIIYITNYLEDGLTKSGRSMQVNNPKGAFLNARAYLYSKFSFQIKMKNAILYNCYGLMAGASAGELWKESPNKLLTFLGFIPGWFLKIKWVKAYQA